MTITVGVKFHEKTWGFLFHQERKSLSLSVTDAPASSTPSLSRSSSVSGADHAGLPSSFFSQVLIKIFSNILRYILKVWSFFTWNVWFLQHEDSLDHSFSTMTMSISGSNLYETARLGGGSSVIESLQSQLKLREGEIAQLQVWLAFQHNPLSNYKYIISNLPFYLQMDYFRY